MSWQNIIKFFNIHNQVGYFLDEVSFTATDRSGEKIIINSDYFKKNIVEIVIDTDLYKFIL